LLPFDDRALPSRTVLASSKLPAVPPSSTAVAASFPPLLRDFVVLLEARVLPLLSPSLDEDFFAFFDDAHHLAPLPLSLSVRLLFNFCKNSIRGAAATTRDAQLFHLANTVTTARLRRTGDSLIPQQVIRHTG